MSTKTRRHTYILNEQLEGNEYKTTQTHPVGIETLFVRYFCSKHMQSRIRSERDIDANGDAKAPHRQMFRYCEFSHRRRGPKILLSTLSCHRNWDDRYLTVLNEASGSKPSSIPPSIVLDSPSRSWMGQV